MDGHAWRSRRETPRDVVRLYLFDHRTAVGKTIGITLLGLDLFFVGMFVAETCPLSASVQLTPWSIEAAVSIVFLAEYLLRLYGARDRTAELLNAYSFIDLLAILPTLAVLVPPVSSVTVNIGSLRAARAVRALRLCRFARDEELFFGTVSAGMLHVMKLLLTVLTIFFVAAGTFYSLEHRVNPNIGSFSDTFYLVVVVLSTVSFDDIVPGTEAGWWVTAAAILAGVIPIPWRASKIAKEWGHRDKVNVTYQNCGLAYHDTDASYCKSCGHVIYQEYDLWE